MARIKELDDLIRGNQDRIYRCLNELEHAFTLGDYIAVKGVAGYIKRRTMAIVDHVVDFEEVITDRKTKGKE